MTLIDTEPDPVEEAAYGYCRRCECNVQTVHADYGIGAYEYWGSKEVHHDWREVCPRCESEVGEVRGEPEIIGEEE